MTAQGVQPESKESYMFEFQKLCNEVEQLTPAERGALMAEKAVSVVEGLHALGLEGADPVETLAAFIVGSVIADGSVSEKDYLNIYPALTEALGEACDLAGISRKLKVSKDVQKLVKSYTSELLSVLSAADEELGADIIMLCLLVTSVDGKVSLKEKRYIKQLCAA